MNTAKTGIVAFAFGTPAKIYSNRELVELSIKTAKKHNAPIYTQLDVSITSDEVSVTHTDETPGNPPPTLRIARGAVQWAIKNGIKVIWVVAAEPHMWRCIRDLKCAAAENFANITILKVREIDDYPKRFWFCKNSTQIRTTSRFEWWKRELILRLMPMWLYKRIAS